MTIARPLEGWRRHLLASLLFASFLLTLFSASALSASAPHAGARSIRDASISRAPSFPAPFAAKRRSSRALVATEMAATDRASQPSGGRFRLPVHSPKRLAFAALSKISRHVGKLRRSTFRAMAVLALVLFGMKGTTAPAHAARVDENSVVASATTKPSAAAKCMKLIVTTGAVAAGAAAAKKFRGFDDDDEEDEQVNSSTIVQDNIIQDNTQKNVAQKVTTVVPEGNPSPLPLSAEWIEQELKEAKEKKSAPPPSVRVDRPHKTTATTTSPAMVKDLDSKIEMLRNREELARADAEKKRLDDIERAAEARKRDQVEIDARIASAERGEQLRLEQEKLEREKLEQEKLERERLERLRLERERTERIQSEREEQRQLEQERLERVQRDTEQKRLEEREEQLAPLETGKQEQSRLEQQTKKDQKQESNVDVEKARQQPKPTEEELELQEKYGSMGLEERAFNILVDLGMVDLHSDPDSSLDWDESDESNAFM